MAQVGGYSVVMALWIYLVLDPNVDEAPDWSFAAAAVFHVAVGYAAGRWRILVLSLLPLLIAMPAGYPGSNFGEPLPLSGTFLIAAPALAVLLALGVAARSFREHGARR